MSEGSHHSEQSSERGVLLWVQQQRRRRCCIGRQKRRVGEKERRPDGGGLRAPSRNRHGRRKKTQTKKKHQAFGIVSSETIPIDSDKTKPNKQQQQTAIYCYYWDTLNAPYESEWFGSDGTISIIRKALGYHYDTIKLVLYAVLNCVKLGILYEALWALSLGAEGLIKPGSSDEQIVADAMERGADHQGDDGRQLCQEKRKAQPVGWNAVQTVVQNLKPDISIIQPQTGRWIDWQEARYNWLPSFSIWRNRCERSP